VTLTLYRFSNAWELDPSPFCAKVQAYLRLCEIPYAEVATVMATLRAPRRKLPYISDDGVVVADSQNIIAHLKRTRGDPLDAGLSPLDHARGHVVTRMLEDGTYWVGVYGRWIEEPAWSAYKPVLFAGVPAPLRNLVAGRQRHNYRRRLHDQGLSRRPEQEIHDLGARDVAAVATLLGDNDYLLGATPSSHDASVYGFLANLYFAPIPTREQSAVASHPNLVAYLERLRKRIGLPSPPAGGGSRPVS
jgi:glutathione S-transferase